MHKGTASRFPPAIEALMGQWGLTLPDSHAEDTLVLQYESGGQISLTVCDGGQGIYLRVTTPLSADAVDDPAAALCFLLQRNHGARRGTGIRYGWLADSAVLAVSCLLAASVDQADLLAAINRLTGHMDALLVTLPGLRQPAALATGSSLPGAARWVRNA